ncbi:MAG: PIN domain-containing protein [Verrucomicrobiota bacterium]
MKVFFDTNVVVAACIADHPHHERARQSLARVVAGKDEGLIAAHSLAEAYAVMTRLPKAHYVAPSVAWQLLSENVLKSFSIITLTAKEYEKALSQAATDGVEGGRTYDLLLLAAAAKSQAERIFTFNVGHFASLAPELADKVTMP